MYFFYIFLVLLWRVQWLALPKWMTLKLIERSIVGRHSMGMGCGDFGGCQGSWDRWDSDSDSDSAGVAAVLHLASSKHNTTTATTIELSHSALNNAKHLKFVRFQF